MIVGKKKNFVRRYTQMNADKEEDIFEQKETEKTEEEERHHGKHGGNGGSGEEKTEEFYR